MARLAQVSGRFIELFRRLLFIVIFFVGFFFFKQKTAYEILALTGVQTCALPILMPVLLVAVLIRMIAAMKTYDLIYILTRGGPGSATETISYSIWKNAFTSLDMGRSAAASFLLLIAILALTVVLVRVMAVGRDD